MHKISNKQIYLFLKKVIITDSCWIWSGQKSHDGYGKITRNNKTVRSHRYSYSIFKGKLEKGMVIDHLCRNILCVNPNHLEQVSVTENNRRGINTPFTPKDIKKIRDLYKKGKLQREIANIFKVHIPAISRIVNFKRWNN